MPPSIQHYRDLILPVISGVEGVQVGILYGSVVTGRMRVESDVDVAVGGVSRMEPGALFDLRMKLAGACDRPVDVVDIQAVSGVILRQILTTGERILVRDQRLYAGMIQRMLYNQADMMPYYRRILRERRERWLAAADGQRSTPNTQHSTSNIQ